MPARKDIQKILILGSGPIVIGQACEFDYSGNQAVRALKEEGYTIVLLNPNPATIMTTPGMADAIYMDPLELAYVEKIIAHEKPDAVLPTMGGQTALNLALEMGKAGLFKKYGVELLGARLESIELAEDRGKFKILMNSIGLESARSVIASDLHTALSFAEKQGLPLIVRPSYTLGGKGGSIVEKKEDLVPVITRAFDESPVHQALIEESLLGWQEFEMEVMRDSADNAVVICSIENIDPMGIHTGDSITVAPVQTLSDQEYQRMRTASIAILRAVGVDCGGSNVQFAYNPANGRMIVIEMNPRVSRSSALASKATGFPIARCSAKLAVGYTLDEIVNEITGKTVSCFEPSLDYVAVKIPRFELEKFPQGYTQLGTQMKSVGESLGLGRSYNEALNKALRSCELGVQGLDDLDTYSDEEVDDLISRLHPKRIFAAYTKILRACRAATSTATSTTDPADTSEIPESLRGVIREISEKSGYSLWVLYNMYELAKIEQRITTELNPDIMLEAKRSGLSDERIAALRGCGSEDIGKYREENNIHACYHFVDTCSGEFEAETPYFYSSWGEINEAAPLGNNAVIILGSGPNRIGQGLEFDTCCTLSSLSYQKRGKKTIIINSNPETVSTDFNVSDRLYMEPLVFEDVKEILNTESVRDIIVQLGGQTPLNMARQLHEWGARIVGTSIENIEHAEDRKFFSEFLRKIGLRQPENRSATHLDQVEKCAEEIAYPVLLRPSYVLGGRSMVIAFNKEEVKGFLKQDINVSPEKPILVDKFLEDAFEYDVDAICDGECVYIAGIMQHIESAGIHSGDSGCIFPPYKTSPEMEKEIIDATVRIALGIEINGFLNIQFAVKDHVLFVLEVNPRASRTVPFISKASGINLVESAVRIWEGQNLREQGLVAEDSIYGIGTCQTGWAVKEAMFSFDRFHNIDPLLGPEMKSTGEVIGLGSSFGEAFAKATLATGTRISVKGCAFVSVHDADKEASIAIVRDLVELGFQILASRGTAEYLFKAGILSAVVLKHYEGHPNAIDYLEAGKIDLIINTPLGRFTQAEDTVFRIMTMRYKVPYTTTISAAQAMVEAIRYLKKGKVSIQSLPPSA